MQHSYTLQLEYTPYGEMWVEDQTTEDLDKIPYRFTSKEWDEETKLYYMSARYQDPMTSRWISADPAGPSLINPMGDNGELRNGFNIIESVNWYTYTGNNPIRYTDPTGYESADAAYCWYEATSEKTIDEKISDLGNYGDPRNANGPSLSDANSKSTIKERIYEDYQAIQGVGESLSQLDSEEDGYGRTGVITGPNIIEVVTNTNKGKAFLVTYDNKKTEGLDGYEVFMTLTPDSDTGLYSGKPNGSPLPKPQANQILRDRPQLS